MQNSLVSKHNAEKYQQGILCSIANGLELNMNETSRCAAVNGQHHNVTYHNGKCQRKDATVCDCTLIEIVEKILRLHSVVHYTRSLQFYLLLLIVHSTRF